jgi:hypothetical protein
MAYSDGPKIVTNGLVLAVDAADRNSYPGSGTTWTDLSGNGNSGTLTNGPTFNSVNGGSIVFDGSNDYISIPDASSIKPATQLTMEATFRMTTKNTFNTILCKPATNAPWTSPFLSYMLRVQAASLQIGLNRNSTYLFIDHTFNYLVNTNYHVVFNIDMTTGVYKYFLNGNLVLNSTITSGGSISYGTQPCLIGAGFGSSPVGELFTGNIYNVKIYNRVLSDSEILQNYNAQKSRFGL